MKINFASMFDPFGWSCGTMAPMRGRRLNTFGRDVKSAAFDAADVEGRAGAALAHDFRVPQRAAVMDAGEPFGLVHPGFDRHALPDVDRVDAAGRLAVAHPVTVQQPDTEHADD